MKTTGGTDMWAVDKGLTDPKETNFAKAVAMPNFPRTTLQAHLAEF